MKNILTVIFFLISFTIANAQNRIEVEIVNFDSDKGVAMVGLFNTAKTFLDKEYKGAKVEIKGKKATAVFTDIPDGIYGVSVFHDENENGEMDTNFLGIPKEDYGASNDAPSKFGPPKWEDAKFEVKNGETKKLKINL